MTDSFRDFGRKGNPRPCPLSDLYQGFPTEAALEAGFCFTRGAQGLFPTPPKREKMFCYTVHGMGLSALVITLEPCEGFTGEHSGDGRICQRNPRIVSRLFRKT